MKASYNDATQIAKNPDLDPLQRRDDFKKLIAELAKKSPGEPEQKP